MLANLLPPTTVSSAFGGTNPKCGLCGSYQPLQHANMCSTHRGVATGLGGCCMAPRSTCLQRQMRIQPHPPSQCYPAPRLATNTAIQSEKAKQSAAMTREGIPDAFWLLSWPLLVLWGCYPQPTMAAPAAPAAANTKPLPRSRQGLGEPLEPMSCPRQKERWPEVDFLFGRTQLQLRAKLCSCSHTCPIPNFFDLSPKTDNSPTGMAAVAC